MDKVKDSTKKEYENSLYIRTKTDNYPSVHTVFVRSLSSCRLYSVGSLDEFVLRFQVGAGREEYI